MKYIVQYAALVMAMLSGTAFLNGFLRFLRTYDYAHQPFTSALVSASDTLFVGVTCLASAKIYQLMIRSKSDAVSKTQTEIEVIHVVFLGAWFCFLFMVHKMNLPHRGVSSWVLPVFWTGLKAAPSLIVHLNIGMGYSSCGPRRSKERPGIRMHIQGVRIPQLWVCVTHLVSRSPHGLWSGAQFWQLEIKPCFTRTLA